jgi:type III secretion protein V
MAEPTPPRFHRLLTGGVAAFVVLVVALLMAPLPTLLVDVLVVVSLAFAAAAFFVSFRVTHAGRLENFPVALLLSTLFRLSLAVAAARLILSQADAGVVIDAIGNLLTAGDPLVGGVVFALIVLMQLIVMARGAERVAEVAARFTLDAMPGRQMAVDADLRAGVINATQAERRRNALTRESDFFGSMDGAMRFVRGEAILSILVVVLVFVVGVGASAGRSNGNLTVADAVTLYGPLTIGAGLATQVPALLLAVAAGLLVTRVSGGADATTAGGSIWENASTKSLPAGFRPILLELGVNLAERVGRDGSLDHRLGELRQQVADDLGTPLPDLAHAVVAGGMEPRDYRVLVHGNPVETGRIESGAAPLDALVVSLEAVLRRHAAELVGLDEVQALLDARRGASPTLVGAIAGSSDGLSRLTGVVRRLVAEDVPVGNLGVILETITIDKNTDVTLDALAEKVREALRRTITHRFTGRDNRLVIFSVDDEIQRLLHGAGVSAGRQLGLDPELCGEIITAARACDGARPESTRHTVFLCDPDVRPILRRLLADELPDTVVLSYRELTPNVQVHSAGRLSLTPEAPAS